MERFSVNPLPRLLIVFFSEYKAIIPDLGGYAVTGKETVEIVFGCLKIQLVYPNDGEHLPTFILAIFYHEQEVIGTMVRVNSWGWRFITPPVEVGVFSPYDDKITEVYLLLGLTVPESSG